MLTLLRLVSSCECGDLNKFFWDGRLRRVTGGVCVLHGPIQLSSLFSNLLLNPPLILSFIRIFVNVLVLENVAHYFPSHRLHLDLTFLC